MEVKIQRGDTKGNEYKLQVLKCQWLRGEAKGINEIPIVNRAKDNKKAFLKQNKKY